MKKKKIFVGLIALAADGFGGCGSNKTPQSNLDGDGTIASPLASRLLLAHRSIRPLTTFPQENPSMVAPTMSTFSKVSIVGLIQALIRMAQSNSFRA
jgi:hypothetical protein